MILDISICIIVLISMIFGYKKGVFKTLAHTFGWILSVILGFFFADELAVLITDKTPVRDKLSEFFSDKAFVTLEGPEVHDDSLPEIVSELRTDIAKTISELLGNTAADAAVTLLSFFLIIIAVKLLFYLAVHLFSREHNDGIIGMMDGILGLAAGILRGGIIVLIVLAVVFPCLAYVSPELSAKAANQLSDSYIAGYLYDNNVMLTFFNILDNMGFK